MAEKEQPEKPCGEPCTGGKIWKDGKCVMPDVTWPAFVMSLNTSALFHLGEIADPATGNKEKDLVLAKHTIDILGLLQEKTRGNLTEEEEKLLEDILFDLKMRYVQGKE